MLGLWLTCLVLLLLVFFESLLGLVAGQLRIRGAFWGIASVRALRGGLTNLKILARLLSTDVVLILATTHRHLVLLGGCWGRIAWLLAIVSGELVFILQEAVLSAWLALAEVLTADRGHHLA